MAYLNTKPHSLHGHEATDADNPERCSARFDLDESFKIPQFIRLGSIRCSETNKPEIFTCGVCQRCIVERQLISLMEILEQFNPIWQNEVFLCFAESLALQQLQWLLDMLKPIADSAEPSTEDMTDILKSRLADKSGQTVRKIVPDAQIQELLRNMTNMVEWFRVTDKASQEIFLLRLLTLSDHSATLYITFELLKIQKTAPQIALQTALQTANQQQKPKNQVIALNTGMLVTGVSFTLMDRRATSLLATRPPFSSQY
jgi:hypothetical protein